MNSICTLKLLHTDAIRKNSTILILGERASGKTTLVHDLLRTYAKNIPLNKRITFSPFENTPGEHTYAGSKAVYARNRVHNNIIDDIHHLTYFLEKQRTLSHPSSGPSYDDEKSESAVVVIEDYNYHYYSARQMANLPTVKSLFMLSRHIKTNVIITDRSPKHLSPNFQANLDYVFICPSHSCTYADEIIHQYAEFQIKEAFEECRKTPYRWLVIDILAHKLWAYDALKDNI